MNVYVLLGEVQYEGQTLLGVYTTRDTAETAAIKYNGEGEYTYDEYTIHEVALDSLAGEYLTGTPVVVD